MERSVADELVSGEPEVLVWPGLLMRRESRVGSPAPDHVELALEESCSALVTLESISARGDPAAEPLPVYAYVHQAIESLRRAINELRLSRSQSSSPIALGFVMAPPRRKRSQSRPRRTA